MSLPVRFTVEEIAAASKGGIESNIKMMHLHNANFDREEAREKKAALLEEIRKDPIIMRNFADDIKTEKLEWLWPNTFPKGKLCILGGIHGRGNPCSPWILSRGLLVVICGRMIQASRKGLET